MKDPAERARLREIGLKYGSQNLRVVNAPEALARRGASIRAKHLAWCPPDQYDFNSLLKRKGYRLAERKRIILKLEPEPTGAEIVERITADMHAKHQRDLASRY